MIGYGETRVEPGRLFDPADGACVGPPPDAIDVQFRAPVSLSLLLDAFDAAHDDAAAAALTAGYQQLIAAMLPKVQFECGYVRTDPATGSRRPARLELAAFVENDVPGIEKMRLHAHVWVGRTAVSLHDGQRYPVDLCELRQGIDQVIHGTYARRLKVMAQDVADVTWGRPRPGAAEEIVDPPLHELAAGADRGVCPSPWGARELLLVDERYLELSAETERAVAADIAAGRPSYWTPPPAAAG